MGGHPISVYAYYPCIFKYKYVFILEILICVSVYMSQFMHSHIYLQKSVDMYIIYLCTYKGAYARRLVR